jgi:hypothetical protein
MLHSTWRMEVTDNWMHQVRPYTWKDCNHHVICKGQIWHVKNSLFLLCLWMLHCQVNVFEQVVHTTMQPTGGRVRVLFTLDLKHYRIRYSILHFHELCYTSNEEFGVEAQYYTRHMFIMALNESILCPSLYCYYLFPDFQHQCRKWHRTETSL